MAKDYHFTIWQDGMPVASGCGADLDAVKRDMVHYASQYAQDGAIEIVASTELAPEDFCTDTITYKDADL